MVSQHALQVVSQHALQQVSRGVPVPGKCLLLGGLLNPPPHQQMATVADGTHPTGMHSCIVKSFPQAATYSTTLQKFLCDFYLLIDFIIVSKKWYNRFENCSFSEYILTLKCKMSIFVSMLVKVQSSP